MSETTEVLVLYYSRYGATKALAREVCHGIDSVKDVAARLRTIPPVSAVSEAVEDPVPEDGPPYAIADDLKECAGLVMGSPTRFGNMAAPLKYFLDGTGSEWLSGVLAGKPAGLFTSTSSPHGGQESTLLTMAVPLLHHGMLIVGLPYTEPLLTSSKTGGSPYGASHVTWNQSPDQLSKEEIHLARALGERVATFTRRLHSVPS